MKKGISVTGIIVFIGLIALIAWGLNYIITKDYVVLRTPIVDNQNNVSEIASVSATISTSTTATSTPIKIATTTSVTIATTTPTKITTSNPNTQPTSSGLTVTFTDKGFSSASLTVKKGQTVPFVNNSSD